MSEITPLRTRLDQLASQSPDWVMPESFDLSNEDDRNRLTETIDAGLVSTIKENTVQIANDLYELRNPNLIDDESAREQFVTEVIERGERYGRWFLFPWDSSLVQYPEERDHQALRTFRNKELITEEEQQELLDSNVAVFGMSVGSNVVLDMVQGGVGGKYIIGDSDVIKPSNLNRMRVDYSDLGGSKLSVVAKRISVIDPYVKQEHYTEGFTSGQMSRLSEDRPDIIVDEVDDLRAKAEMRLFAKQNGIPLLMATDIGDTTLIDVERYDYEDPKPFNGSIGSKDIELITSGDADEQDLSKLRAKIVGVKNVSPRLLESVMEVGDSLSGIPQLGTTAGIGGALATVATREILLGNDLPSGRYKFNARKVLSLKPQTGLLEAAKIYKDFILSR